jgi:hypothetical protein
MTKTKRADEVTVGDRLVIQPGRVVKVTQIEQLPYDYVRFYFRDRPARIGTSTWKREWEAKVEE